MKSFRKKLTAVLLCVVLCFTALTPISSAASCGGDSSSSITFPTTENGGSVFSGLKDVNSADDLKDNTAKVFYNVLNKVVECLAKAICAVIPAPKSWVDKEDYDDSLVLKGRDTYQTEAADTNAWSLGYAKVSLVPDDFEAGKYYLGRDLTNRMAQGVHDDMCIRIAAVDDGSGEGITLIGAIDALGVTSTDVREIRKQLLAYYENSGVKISGINIMSTHSHSALDTQGTSTEFVYKLFTAGYTNLFNVTNDKKLATAESFKKEYIAKSVEAAKQAISNMTKGRLFFTEVDVSYYVLDKRELISSEDIPKVAALKFIPDDGTASTYLTDFSCHPTSFSASNGLVSSDYIYYLDNYISENDNGSNLVFFQGSLGQLSRQNVGFDSEGKTEAEILAGDTKLLGEHFGRLLLEADFSEELQPILNEKHETMWLYPENSILLLACKINLVNNQVCYDGLKKCIPSEVGYVEFGHRIAFAMFPGEFYPEVFWGHEIIGDTTWDGTEWNYGSLHNSVKDGVDVYCICLANDATGYVVTDDNFAFMGHIIGDEIADEVLSVGKHQASTQISAYLDLIDSLGIKAD